MIEVVFENEIIKIVQIGFAFAVLIAMILYIFKKKRNTKIAKIEQNVNSLEDISTVILNYFENGKFTDKTFWLILLDLVHKGFYTIYKNQDNDYMIHWNKEDMFALENYDLEEYEEEIVKFLNPFLLEGNMKNKEIPIKELKEKFQVSMRFHQVIPNVYRELKNQIAQDYGFLEKGRNIQFIVVTIFLYYFLMFPNFELSNMLVCVLYLFIGIMIGVFLSGNKNSWFRVGIVWVFYYGIALSLYPILSNIFVPYHGMITWLSFFNPLLLLTICLIGTTNFTNQKQQSLFEKIYLSKMMIKENLLNNNNINKDKIEKYYVMAEAFNISLSELPMERLSESEKEFVLELIEREEALQYLGRLFN